MSDNHGNHDASNDLEGRTLIEDRTTEQEETSDG